MFNFQFNVWFLNSLKEVIGHSPRQAGFLVTEKEKGKREVERCCFMKSRGYFSYIFHQLSIKYVVNLKIIEHKTRVYEVIVSAEVKEVFKLDIISYSFFHLPYKREMRKWYLLLPWARRYLVKKGQKEWTFTSSMGSVLLLL